MIFYITGHNDCFVMAGHNDSESHKTHIRLRVPQDSSQTRFKSNKTQYICDGKCTCVIVGRISNCEMIEKKEKKKR